MENRQGESVGRVATDGRAACWDSRGINIVLQYLCATSTFPQEWKCILFSVRSWLFDLLDKRLTDSLWEPVVWFVIFIVLVHYIVEHFYVSKVSPSQRCQVWWKFVSNIILVMFFETDLFINFKSIYSITSPSWIQITNI